MTLEQALALVKAAVTRSSQGRVAKQIDVSTSTVSRWLAEGASEPLGEAREKLFRWAEAQPVQPEEPEEVIPPAHGLPPEAALVAALAPQEMWVAITAAFTRANARQRDALWDYTIEMFDVVSGVMRRVGPPPDGPWVLPIGIVHNGPTGGADLHRTSADTIKKHAAEQAGGAPTESPHRNTGSQ